MRTVEELYNYALNHNYIEGDYSEEEHKLFEKTSKFIPMNDEAICVAVFQVSQKEFQVFCVCFRQTLIITKDSETPGTLYSSHKPSLTREASMNVIKKHFDPQKKAEEEALYNSYLEDEDDFYDNKIHVYHGPGSYEISSDFDNDGFSNIRSHVKYLSSGNSMNFFATQDDEDLKITLKAEGSAAKYVEIEGSTITAKTVASTEDLTPEETKLKLYITIGKITDYINIRLILFESIFDERWV